MLIYKTDNVQRKNNININIMDREEELDPLEERLEEICGIDDDIKNSFKTLLDANEENGQDIDLFLNNLVKIFLSNRMFVPEFNNVLIYCCQEFKYNSAFALLDNPNVDVNGENLEGDTALMYCSDSKDEMSVRVAEKLIQKGARVEHINKKKRNALLFCCIHDSETPTLQIALLLLDVDARNQDGDDHQFQVDYKGSVGIEYLLDFERPDYEDTEEEYKNELCSNESYVTLVVKYLDLYNKRRPADPIFEKCMEIICNDEKLNETFNKPLADVGIRLYSYCKEPTQTDARYEDVSVAQPLPEGITDELAVEAVETDVGTRAPPDPHELRWVRPEDERLYVRQGGPKEFGRGGGKRKRTKRRVPKQKKNKVTRRKQNQK